MLRYATGYYLASKGQDTQVIQAYAGHKNKQYAIRSHRRKGSGISGRTEQTLSNW
jgi:hypothetical protein